MSFLVSSVPFTLSVNQFFWSLAVVMLYTYLKAFNSFSMHVEFNTNSHPGFEVFPYYASKYNFPGLSFVFPKYKQNLCYILLCYLNRLPIIIKVYNIYQVCQMWFCLLALFFSSNQYQSIVLDHYQCPFS